jgi:hypothetical protein
MSRTLSASDRASLIRLASTLPAGSPERKAILAGLSRSGSDENADIAYTAFASWWNKNRSEIEKLESVWVKEIQDGFVLNLDIGYDKYDRYKDLELTVVRDSLVKEAWGASFYPSYGEGGIPNTKKLEDAEDAARNGRLTDKLVFAALDRVLAIARAYEAPKLKTKMGPEGEIQYYMGAKFIGEVWKGLDRKWHNSKNTHLVFRSREDAKADLLGDGSSGKGSPAPIFE